RPGARRPSPAVRRDPVLRPRERPPWPRDRCGDLSQAGGGLMARGAWAIAVPLVLLSSLFVLTMEVRSAGPSLSILSPAKYEVILPIGECPTEDRSLHLLRGRRHELQPRGRTWPASCPDRGPPPARPEWRHQATARLRSRLHRLHARRGQHGHAASGQH